MTIFEGVFHNCIFLTTGRVPSAFYSNFIIITTLSNILYSNVIQNYKFH